MPRKHRRPSPQMADAAREYGVRLPQETETTVSPNEAGDVLGITGEAVKRWIYTRKLPAAKLMNGYWRVKVSDIAGLVEGKRNMPERPILIFAPDSGISSAHPIVQTHEVIFALNPIDALMKARSQPPRLCLIQTSADGWEFVQKLRRERATASVPILFLHDTSAPFDVDRALSLRIQGCLPLPVSETLLMAEIQAVLLESRYS